MITQRLQQPNTKPQLESQTAVYTREETDRPNPLLSWGLIIMFLGAAIGVVGKKLMHEDVVTVIGVLVALAGMFLSVYPYVLLPRSNHGGSASESELKAQSERQKSLPQERTTEYVPGITERTTDLLTNSVVRGKRAEAKKSQE